MEKNIRTTAHKVGQEGDEGGNVIVRAELRQTESQNKYYRSYVYFIQFLIIW